MVEKVLVSIYILYGLVESIDIIIVDWEFTYIVNYGNFPFRCLWFHIVSHVVEYCETQFVKNIWEKKE
jgi:hypothetical protein